jgi:HPt (histidine-containing phosphotransfer) domain-containing protein
VPEDDELQQQIASIGTRYLQRTLTELPRLYELCAQPDGGALAEIERLAHKIYGSGAMFGFEQISERAREVELLAARRAAEPATMSELRAGIAALERQVRETARERGVQ